MTRTITAFKPSPAGGKGLVRDTRIRWALEEVGHKNTTGLRRLLDLQQQRDWMEGKTIPRDADERSESLELRFKYVARFEKLLRRPQAPEVLEILRRYGRDCIPIPRQTERHYWSVSCLPSTRARRSFASMRAGWSFSRSMRKATTSARFSSCIFRISPRIIHSIRARWTKHSSSDASRSPEDVGYFFPRGEDIFGIKVRGFSSIGKFLAAAARCGPSGRST